MPDLDDMIHVADMIVSKLHTTVVSKNCTVCKISPYKLVLIIFSNSEGWLNSFKGIFWQVTQS